MPFYVVEKCLLDNVRLHLHGCVISGLVDNIWNVVNVIWRLPRYLEHVRWRMTGGTHTFPERFCVRSRDLMMQYNACLEVWCFNCSAPYCGFCDLPQPTARTEDNRIGLTLCLWVWPRTLFWSEDKNGIENSRWEFGTAHAIWLRRSVFFRTTRRCIGIMRIMPSPSCLVCLDVVDTGYIDFVVWIFDLNFVPFVFEAAYQAFHLEMWVGDYSGRYITTGQLYWAGLHWECRTEHSVLDLGLKLKDVISLWRADLERELSVLHYNVLWHTLRLLLFLRNCLL